MRTDEFKKLVDTANQLGETKIILENNQSTSKTEDTNNNNNSINNNKIVEIE